MDTQMKNTNHYQNSSVTTIVDKRDCSYDNLSESFIRILDLGDIKAMANTLFKILYAGEIKNGTIIS